MRSIQEQWTGYDKKVLPRDAGVTQRTECQRAFYAGALSMINVMSEIATAGLSHSAEEATIQGLEQELNEYFTGQLG